MKKTITLYRFKVRNPTTDKLTQTRHRMTIERAAARHGAGNYELIEWSKEVRQVDPLRNSAAHLQSTPGRSGDVE
jgi:hypothetical protein